MRNLDVSPAVLRKFAIQVFITLFVMGTVLFFKHKDIYIWFYLAGMLFLLGVFMPSLTKPVYSIFTKSAFISGLIITRLIMLVIFYLLFTPFGLAIRLFRIDFLNRKIEKNKKSYWEKNVENPPNPLDWERQF